MNKWRKPGTVFVCLALAALILLAGCTLGTPETPAQQIRVSRGDLTVSINGNGFFQSPNDVRLTFPISGRLDKLNVKEGDHVTKGAVLAQLDTGALELSRRQAEVSLTQAKLAETQARLARQSAEYELSRMEDKRSGLQLALLKTDIDIRSAQYSLDKAQDTYRWPEVEVSQAEVDKARSQVEYATLNLSTASTPEAAAVWTAALVRAQAVLDAAEAKLKAQLIGYDTEEVAIKKMQLDAARSVREQAQKDLDALIGEFAVKQAQVDAAAESVQQAGESVKLAQQALDEARKRLDEAAIVAPFDGSVAGKSASEGDTVTPASMIVRLVDDTSLDLVIELDEIDIPSIAPGQEAVIEVDALPGQAFKGEVVSIYPVPNTVGGVVLYSVKINLPAAPESGLRMGMSATADIVMETRQGVLLLPNRAIEHDSQGKPFVRVPVNEEVQEKPVVTGLSDGLNTEIISGLSENDIVIVGGARSTAGGLF
ncbi:MAG: efflux RND transporter periplasmic adaptor subunit [Chloroflexi bacterium]|nr:efflux RND transporter periplasmic adaptor subunit [Chloroflexota bacterium]